MLYRRSAKCLFGHLPKRKRLDTRQYPFQSKVKKKKKIVPYRVRVKCRAVRLSDHANKQPTPFAGQIKIPYGACS